MQTALLVHLALNVLTIESFLGLNYNNILVFLRGRLATETRASGVLHNILNPSLEATLSIKPVIRTVRAQRGRYAHPDEEGMFAMPRREGVCEQKACIGDVGETQGVLATQAFGFIERPRCIYGGW